ITPAIQTPMRTGSSGSIRAPNVVERAPVDALTSPRDAAARLELRPAACEAGGGTSRDARGLTSEVRGPRFVVRASRVGARCSMSAVRGAIALDAFQVCTPVTMGSVNINARPIAETT